jgi:LysR family transcriptional regulator for metE and metH
MITGPIRTRKIKSTLLYRDEMLAVLPAGHPKAERTYFRASDFEDETFVTETMEREWMGKSKNLFERLGSTPRRIMRVGHREAALALINSGLAITAETREKLGIYGRNKNIVMLPITKSGLFAEYYLASATKLDTSSPEAAVVRALREVISSKRS